MNAAAPPAAHLSEIEAVWRIESARILASLVRMVRDVDLAEEFAQEAFVAALSQWPESGVPRNPGAWLLTVGRNRALDHFRKSKRISPLDDQRQEQASTSAQLPDLDDDVGDDLLRLMFIACHPVLPQDARVALTLRLLGGLTTAEIARAYLTSEPTVAQRLVRAKRTLANADAPFELPRGEDRKARLPVVLEAIYLIFNEGYAATAGEDWMRPALCQEAQRLARILVGLVPHDPEVHGLAALLDLQASRMHARTDRNGKPVLLLDQNRARWDRVLIQRGLASLAQAELQTSGQQPGPYLTQAAIAACHARAVTPEQTDWKRIAQLYAQLASVAPSPVVELNRAVAVGMAFGPQAGLDLADALAAVPALRGYHLLPSVRGEFLERLGRLDEARQAFATAAALTQNEREREVLLARAGKS